MDPGYKHGGTHWVALRVSTTRPDLILYIDSFGAPPPTDVYNLASDLKRKVAHTTGIWQHLKEEDCGPRSLSALQEMENGPEWKAFKSYS
jgi:hypothetical protein